MSGANFGGVCVLRTASVRRFRPLTAFASLLVVVGSLLAAPAVSRGGDDGTDRFVYGIVVDERRVPKGGARIAVRWGDRTSNAEADGAGRFAIRIPLPTGDRGVEALVEAVVGMPPDELLATASVRPVVVARAGEGSMLVVRSPIAETFTLIAEGRPAAGARLRLLAGSKHNPIVLRDVEADAEGKLSVRLAPGSYGWAVLDKEFAEQGSDVTLPIEQSLTYDPRTIELFHPRTVRVRAVDETGAPVAACRAGFYFGGWGDGTAPAKPDFTDARGEIVLGRVPPHSVRITVWCTDPPSQGEVRVDAGASSAEVQLVRRTLHTAQWPVLSSPARPPNATPIVFRFQEYRKLSSMPGRVDNDQVIVGGLSDPSEYGYAVDCERCAALLRYDLEGSPSKYVSTPATFLDAKRSVLRLVDDAGVPIAGQPVSMDGWFLLRDAEGRLTRTTSWGETTDAEGQVVFDGVFWEPARLKLRPGPAIAAERELGLFDPDATPDRVVVIRVPRPRTLEIHVTLDGVPGLRSDLTVHAGGTVAGYEADPTAGIVRVPVSIDPSAASMLVAVSASGFESWSEWLDVTKPLPAVLHADLRREATIALDVTPNPDSVRGEDVQLHRFDVSEGRWLYEGDADHGKGAIWRRMELERAGIRCWYAFRSAVGRRYRVVHVPSGSATPSFDLSSGETVHPVTLSIEATRRVRGHLLAGPDLTLEQVVLEHDHAVAGLGWDAGSHEIRDAGSVEADGAFEIVVPVGRSTRITIRHPLLLETTFIVPIELDGPLDVSVEARAILTIPFDAEDPPIAARSARADVSNLMSCIPFSAARYQREQRRAALSGAPTVAVRRVDGDRPKEWTRLETVRLANPDRLRLGLDVTGRYDVFLDSTLHAPLLLRDVLVGTDGAVHEAVRFMRGGEVRVRVDGSTRNAILKTRVRATPVDPSPFPPYVRYLEAVDGAVAVATGLVPGRWTIAVTVDRRLGPAQGEPAAFERAIELIEGRAPPELEIDLRPPSERRPADEPTGHEEDAAGR